MGIVRAGSGFWDSQRIAANCRQKQIDKDIDVFALLDHAIASSG